MAAVPIYTYKDMLDHLVDFLGGHPGAEALRDARRSTLSALRELTSSHNWAYFYRSGRLNTAAPYLTGTVAYDHTGGAYERLVTLDSGVWPDWAFLGTLEIANVPYEVASRKSSTEITLSVHSNPGLDIAAGTGYSLYRDSYPLPADCRSVGKVIISGHMVELLRDHPNAMLDRKKILRSPAMPRTYNVIGSADYMNTMSMNLYPPPDQAYAIDFIYQKRPRQLLLDDYHTGKVATTSGSAAVTGSGTAWSAARLLGSVFRVSRDPNAAPSAPWGSNPAVCSRIITSVPSATSLILDDTVPESLGSAPYLISDPVDIEDGAMLTALLRAAEFQMGLARSKDNVVMLAQSAREALILAREADSRSFADERVGGSRPYPVRMADMPIDF